MPLGKLSFSPGSAGSLWDPSLFSEKHEVSETGTCGEHSHWDPRLFPEESKTQSIMEERTAWGFLNKVSQKENPVFLGNRQSPTLWDKTYANSIKNLRHSQQYEAKHTTIDKLLKESPKAVRTVLSHRTVNAVKESWTANTARGATQPASIQHVHFISHRYVQGEK